jgi:hypothetical protein
MDILIPTPLLERHNIPPNIKHIAAGYTFSMALTSAGEVYSWGQGESGELGHAPKVLAYAPTQITDFTRIEQIACGHRHAAAVQFIPRTLHFEEETDVMGKSERGDTNTEVSSSRPGSGTATPRSSKSASTKFSNFTGLQVMYMHAYMHT